MTPRSGSGWPSTGLAYVEALKAIPFPVKQIKMGDPIMTPSHAISLWISSSNALIASIDGHEVPIQQWEPKLACRECGTQMQIPRGLRGLLEILRERERARAPETIGYLSNPVASDVNGMRYLADVEVKRRNEIENERAKAMESVWQDLFGAGEPA